MTDLNTLASMVEQSLDTNNALDVQCEIALFTPDTEFTAVRANSAGTKVIYTKADGGEETFWAHDWTLGRETRKATAAALRSRAAMGDG